MRFPDSWRTEQEGRVPVRDPPRRRQFPDLTLVDARLRLEVEVQFGELRDELTRLVDTDLAALERKLDAAGVPWTPGRGVPEGR